MGRRRRRCFPLQSFGSPRVGTGNRSVTHGLEPISRLERDREAGKGILRVANEMNVDVVVIGLDPSRSIDGDPVGPTTETLLRRANFEVIVDRPSPAPVE